MTRRMRAGWLGAALAACSGAPPPSGSSSPPPAATPAAHAVPVAIEFEPALIAPGTLVAVHENGQRVEVPAAPTGVEIALPPGPASIELVTGGARYELVVHVTAGMAPLCWAWQQDPATMRR
jgi:hypothetical protein